MENKSEFTHRYCWLNIADGSFSNSWTEEEHLKYGVSETEITPGWKLLKFECINDPKFEFNHLMRIA